MKKILLLAIGISFGMITESKAQKIPATYTANGFTKDFNDNKVNKAHFKINKTYHYPQIGFMHAGIKGYRAEWPQITGVEGLQTAKMQMHRRVHILPLYSSVSFGLFPLGAYAKQPDFCSCHTLGVKLYQCRANRVNTKNLQPAINPVDKKFADYSSDEDGGIDINLKGATSLNVDLGYTKLSANPTNDLAMDMDGNSSDGPGISIGLQFGIGK